MANVFLAGWAPQLRMTIVIIFVLVHVFSMLVFGYTVLQYSRTPKTVINSRTSTTAVPVACFCEMSYTRHPHTPVAGLPGKVSQHSQHQSKGKFTSFFAPVWSGRSVPQNQITTVVWDLCFIKQNGQGISATLPNLAADDILFGSI